MNDVQRMMILVWVVPGIFLFFGTLSSMRADWKSGDTGWVDRLFEFWEVILTPRGLACVAGFLVGVALTDDLILAGRADPENLEQWDRGSLWGLMGFSLCMGIAGGAVSGLVVGIPLQWLLDWGCNFFSRIRNSSSENSDSETVDDLSDSNSDLTTQPRSIASQAVCTGCKKKFSFQEGEKPRYVCDECGKSLKYRGNAKERLKRLGEPDRLLEGVPKLKLRTTPDDCTYCGETALQNATLPGIGDVPICHRKACLAQYYQHYRKRSKS